MEVLRVSEFDNIQDFIFKLWMCLQRDLFSYSGCLDSLDDLIDQKERELKELKQLRDQLRRK